MIIPELKKYEIRGFEIDALERVCGRIDCLITETQQDIERCNHRGEYADGEEPSDWELQQAVEYPVKLRAYESALAAVMKLMGV